MPLDPAEVAARVLQSRRYRHVAPQLVRRLAAEEAPKSRNLADAQKRTQRRLHQIFGAYTNTPPYAKMLAELSAAKNEPPAFKAACREAMKRHASTAERVGLLDEFHARIFHITGRPDSIMDLACGLHPLSIPWMNLEPAARYLAGDIDAEMTAFLNAFFALAHGGGHAALNDLVTGPIPASVDVAFVLKTLPCLGHQISDPVAILDAIDARWLVVSFPTRSLGNRGKGMERTYREWFEKQLAKRPWRVTDIQFVNELVFIVRK
jgi:16S rRNA (guanine(1405)-N(7))-methyltransferase